MAYATFNHHEKGREAYMELDMIPGYMQAIGNRIEEVSAQLREYAAEADTSDIEERKMMRARLEAVMSMRKRAAADTFEVERDMVLALQRGTVARVSPTLEELRTALLTAAEELKTPDDLVRLREAVQAVSDRLARVKVDIEVTDKAAAYVEATDGTPYQRSEQR